MPFTQQFIFFLAFAVLSGCASARMSETKADRAFRDGHYEEAASQLKEGLDDAGEGHRDELLYVLDIGLSLHAAGKLEESNAAFLKADQLAEIKDYTSLSAEVGTLLTSDNIKQYKGEDHEKVLINTYLAMNFALMGESESALVEARKVNHKLRLMISEGERPYKQNSFAYYLSATLYESEGEYDDAYIDYKKVLELNPSFPDLGVDLWRIARLSGNRDECRGWEKHFGLTEEDKISARNQMNKKDFGEIIVLYENGISPIKRPHPTFYSIPKFYPRHNPVRFAYVKIDGERVGHTALLEDIEATAIHNLDEKYAGIIAKKLAGVVAKEVVGKQVENVTGSKFLGFLTKIFFYVSDQADVRSWNLLPRDLQIARFAVKPGTHRVELEPDSDSPMPEKMISIEAGKKVFVNGRFMP